MQAKTAPPAEYESPIPLAANSGNLRGSGTSREDKHGNEVNVAKRGSSLVQTRARLPRATKSQLIPRASLVAHLIDILTDSLV